MAFVRKKEASESTVIYQRPKIRRLINGTFYMHNLRRILVVCQEEIHYLLIFV